MGRSHPGAANSAAASWKSGQGLDVLRQAIGEIALEHLNASARAPLPTLPDGTPVIAPLAGTTPAAAH